MKSNFLTLLFCCFYSIFFAQSNQIRLGTTPITLFFQPTEYVFPLCLDYFHTTAKGRTFGIETFTIYHRNKYLSLPDPSAALVNITSFVYRFHLNKNKKKVKQWAFNLDAGLNVGAIIERYNVGDYPKNYHNGTPQGIAEAEYRNKNGYTNLESAAYGISANLGVEYRKRTKKDASRFSFGLDINGYGDFDSSDNSFSPFVFPFLNIGYYFDHQNKKK